MRIGPEKLSRLDLWALIVGTITLWLLAVVISAAWGDGLVAVMSASFGIAVAFLALHGVAVLFSVRGRGRVRFSRVLLVMLGLCLVFSALVILTVYIGDSELVLDGVDLFTPAGAALGLLSLWIILLILSVLMLAAACSAIWLLEKVLRRAVPRFLTDIRGLDYTRRDSWLARAEAWAVAFPRVLLPGTLRLEPQPLDPKAANGRLRRALLWQMVLGMLLAVYISLNPVLLQSMSFSQTFSLVSLTSLLVPVLVLPWSTLEALGARVDGVREDFYLYRGARTRMTQTVVALGTLFLIVRLAVQQIGAEVIAWRLLGYSVTLFIVSGLVSFAYFNYFERGLIEELRRRLESSGL